MNFQPSDDLLCQTTAKPVMVAGTRVTCHFPSWNFPKIPVSISIKSRREKRYLSRWSSMTSILFVSSTYLQLNDKQTESRTFWNKNWSIEVFRMNCQLALNLLPLMNQDYLIRQLILSILLFSSILSSYSTFKRHRNSNDQQKSICTRRTKREGINFEWWHQQRQFLSTCCWFLLRIYILRLYS